MVKDTRLGDRKQNLIITIGAILLAFGIFFIIKNPDFFAASVLSLQEKAFIAEKGWDIAYKTDSGYVDIFLSEQSDTPAKIDFMVIFDKENIVPNIHDLSGQATWSVAQPDETTIQIHATPIQEIDKSQSLILMPFSGDSEKILVSEAKATMNDGNEKNLSIGSLNELTTHSQ